MVPIFELFVGGAMIGVTVVFHALSLDLIMKRAAAAEHVVRNVAGSFYKALFSCWIVLAVFVVHIVNIWLWACLYLVLDCEPIKTLADSLYFSTVTYTTVGYGDITLDAPSRMLAAIEAMNGFLLFGWTTAFIFEIVSRVYKKEAQNL